MSNDNYKKSQMCYCIVEFIINNEDILLTLTGRTLYLLFYEVYKISFILFHLFQYSREELIHACVYTL